MTVGTEGIVVYQVRYGDHSLVVKVYTRAEGMQSFVVKGVGKRGGRFRTSYFFPLSQIELSYTPSGRQGKMAFLRDVKVSYAYREMYSDVRKSSVAFFLAEVMGRCITQAECDAGFYEKIAGALRQFDLREQHVAEFHLYFLLELASVLGVYPQASSSVSDRYFDLRDGGFSSVQPGHSDFLAGRDATNLSRLLAEHARSADGFPALTLFSSTDRFALLQALAQYCRIQAGVEGAFRSADVLREVFA